VVAGRDPPRVAQEIKAEPIYQINKYFIVTIQ